MSFISSVIFFIVVSVILFTMQLSQSVFAIFYHFALAKKSSKAPHRLADNFSLFYIFGNELFYTSMWLFTYFILYALFYSVENLTHNIFFWVLAGILIAEAILFFIIYFRRAVGRKFVKQNSTALFIPRTFAHNLTSRAQSVKTQKDAFLLGFFTAVPELIFTLPLFITANLVILSTPTPTSFFIIFAIIAAALPLFAIRCFYRTGHTLADYQRLHAKAKPFIRAIVPLLYLSLAAIIISWELHA
ncbi:hypothetical protein IJ117_00725 [Candidatus Saccharibacteria bacterium]|nr:hypothetical protein [Candidatus Saccharibacteria bacterium]